MAAMNFLSSRVNYRIFQNEIISHYNKFRVFTRRQRKIACLLAFCKSNLHTVPHEYRTFHASSVDHLSGGLSVTAFQPDNAVAKNPN